jgi:hypothetical protein
MIRLDDNVGFESFQLWWHAVVFGLPRLGLRSGETELRRKLEWISRPVQGDGFSRMLIRPCAVELTPEERLLLVECLAAVEWRPRVLGPVARAAALVLRGGIGSF